MVTTRTPIHRPPISHITPRAVELFKQMQAITYGSERRRLHLELHGELDLKPWQWPAVQGPDEVNTYPAGSVGGEWFAEAQRLHRGWRRLPRNDGQPEADHRPGFQHEPERA